MLTLPVTAQPSARLSPAGQVRAAVSASEHKTPSSLSYDPGDFQPRGTVSDTVVTVYAASWVLEISGGPLCKVRGYLTTVLCARN